MKSWLNRALWGSIFLVLPLEVALAAEWREAAPMEGARSQLRAVAVGGEIYVAGGAGLSGPVATFEVYDPVANLWHALPSLPDGREAFGMAALGPTIFISGGLSSWGEGKATAETNAFDTVSGAWTSRAPMPAALSGHVMVAGEDRLYAVGGRGERSHTLLVYNPSADEWAYLGEPMPVPRMGHAVAIRSGRIYVIGGRALDGAALSRVDVYDLKSNTWSQGPSLPSAAVGLTADLVGTRIHVAGGVAPAARKTLADHYAFDGSAWAKLKPLPTPRHGLASAVHGGNWYAIGGGAGSGAYAVFTRTDVVEVYTP